MADFTAIAAATRTIRRLLIDRMETAGVAVTTSPPDVTVANINGPRVNFYLYEVHEHPDEEPADPGPGASRRLRPSPAVADPSAT